MAKAEREEEERTRLRLQARLSRAVGNRESRKMRARRETHRGIWFGLGMFGVVGWSVAIPTLVGVGLGIWLDRTHPGRYSWTLMLLMAGIAAGCLNAWFWVTRERRAITEREEEQGGE